MSWLVSCHKLENEQPTLVPDERQIAMNKNALVVIDVQNDFIDGALGSKEAQETLPRIVEKVRGFQGCVLATKDTHFDGYLETQEGKNLPVPHCIKGTNGWDFPEELAELMEERAVKVFEKTTFGSVDLARELKRLFDHDEIESVEFVGFCTDICVVSNALLTKAESPELPVFVDARCCAGVTPEKHESALDVLESCQVQVKR